MWRATSLTLARDRPARQPIGSRGARFSSNQSALSPEWAVPRERTWRRWRPCSALVFVSLRFSIYLLHDFACGGKMSLYSPTVPGLLSIPEPARPFVFCFCFFLFAFFFFSCVITAHWGEENKTDLKRPVWGCQRRETLSFVCSLLTCAWSWISLISCERAKIIL